MEMKNKDMHSIVEEIDNCYIDEASKLRAGRREKEKAYLWPALAFAAGVLLLCLVVRFFVPRGNGKSTAKAGQIISETYYASENVDTAANKSEESEQTINVETETENISNVETESNEDVKETGGENDLPPAPLPEYPDNPESITATVSRENAYLRYEVTWTNTSDCAKVVEICGLTSNNTIYTYPQPQLKCSYDGQGILEDYSVPRNMINKGYIVTGLGKEVPEDCPTVLFVSMGPGQPLRPGEYCTYTLYAKIPDNSPIGMTVTPSVYVFVWDMPYEPDIDPSLLPSKVMPVMDQALADARNASEPAIFEVTERLSYTTEEVVNPYKESVSDGSGSFTSRIENGKIIYHIEYENEASFEEDVRILLSPDIGFDMNTLAVTDLSDYDLTPGDTTVSSCGWSVGCDNGESTIFFNRLAPYSLSPGKKMIFEASLDLPEGTDPTSVSGRAKFMVWETDDLNRYGRYGIGEFDPDHPHQTIEFDRPEN